MDSRRVGGLLSALVSEPPPSSASRGAIDPSLIREIFALTLPVALSSLVDSLVGILDIYMVSHLGSEAISAVGMSRILTMVIGVIIGATSGGFTMVAQAIGAGSMQRASAAAKQTLTLTVLITTPFCALGFAAAGTMLEAMSLTPQVVALGVPYMRIICAGMVLMGVNYAVTSCLYGAGDTRTPLLVGLFTTAVKVAASYVLIFGALGFPQLGVTGAAVGSVCGAVSGLVINFAVIYSGRFRLRILPASSYLPDPELARRILRVGLPTAMQGILRNGSGLVFAKLVALTASSAAAVAAYSIANQVERLLRRTSLSFGTAATTLVGQSLGALKVDEAQRRGSTTILVAVVSMVICSAPVALAASYIMDAFSDEPDVIRIGVAYLVALSLAEPFMSLSTAAAGSLRGAGDTRPPMYYAGISQWLVRLPVGYLLAFHAGFDVVGLWASLVCYCATQGLLMYLKFRKGEWKVLRI